MNKIFTLIVFILTTFVVIAQNTELNKDDWKFGFQSQIRSELDGRDFANKTYAPTYTFARFRFSVEKTLFGNMNFFLQLNDSRVWGQELAPNNNIMNVDLHQGYLKILNLFNQPIYAQAGKFEMAYGDQRIFGSSNWNNVSRSWDGVRLGYDTKNAKIDLFALSYWWNNSINRVLPTTYNYPIPYDTSFSLYGLYTQWGLSEGHTLDVYGYYELNRKKKNNIDPDKARYTAGLRYKGVMKNFFAGFELAYQSGRLLDNGIMKDVKAMLINGGLGIQIDEIKFSLNADIQSGTEPGSNEYGLFDGMHSTKHSINGYMDYFTDLSTSTGATPTQPALGLNDLFLKFNYNPNESDFSAEFMAHYFMSNKTGKNANQSDRPTAFGQEFDVVLRYKINQNSTFEWGGCVFLPGDLMKELYKKTDQSGTIILRGDDPAFWSYLMLRVNL